MPTLKEHTVSAWTSGRKSCPSKAADALAVGGLVYLVLSIQTMTTRHFWSGVFYALVATALYANSRTIRKSHRTLRSTLDTRLQWASSVSAKLVSGPPAVNDIGKRRRLLDYRFPQEWGRSHRCRKCGKRIFWVARSYRGGTRIWYNPDVSFLGCFFEVTKNGPVIEYGKPHSPVNEDPLARLLESDHYGR